MMKILTIFLLIIIASAGFAQNNNIENWRTSGYEAKINGDYKSAISYYEKILKNQADDYDAKLALANLYYLQEDYEKAISYFNDIYTNDSTDVEALKGLGDCYLNLDKLDTAAEYYKKAFFYLPSYVPAYFQLAKVFSWQGDLNKAIEVYNKIIAIDSTYSEAWQGIGKMLYWQEKPETALLYYRKAIQLDPEEENILEEYREINKLVQYQFSGTFQILNETEEEYQINAFMQKYNFQKRIGNNFNIAVNFLLDYSDRDFTNTEIGDTTRWYDNTSLILSWITEHHRLNTFGGYSKSDNKFSSYGTNWKWNFPIKSFDFTNSFTAGYDYFYYWNRVGHHFISDNLLIRYRKLGLNISYGYGLVDSVMIADVYNDKYNVDFNKHNEYALSLSYKLLSNPIINVALNYSYLNYQYKSPLYYSPIERQLYGPSGTIYYSYKNFYFYGSFSYNIGSEVQFEGDNSSLIQENVNVDNWSAETELGYNLNSFSLFISASRFYNPFYSNYFVFLSAKIYL